VLAEVASSLNRIGAWANIYDREYRFVYSTDDFRLTNGGLVEMVPVPLDVYLFGPEYFDALLSWSGWSLDGLRGIFTSLGPWALADAPGGREERNLLTGIASILIQDVLRRRRRWALLHFLGP
jgi:hypothetical protein